MALRVNVSSAPPRQSWRNGLPLLRAGDVSVRELEVADAAALFDIASRDEVSRFAWPAPDGIAAVEQFIRVAHEERRSGRYLCFAILSGSQLAGMFELRRLQPDFFRAEAGFCIAPGFWGTGVFAIAAQLICEFAFTVIGIHRIEARVIADNVRSGAALRKLGAVREGVLHDAFRRGTQYVDQIMWALLRRRWSGLPVNARTRVSPKRARR